MLLKVVVMELKMSLPPIGMWSWWCNSQWSAKWTVLLNCKRLPTKIQIKPLELIDTKYVHLHSRKT